MKIAGYLKTSLLDWPGKVTGVIFTVGCNFRCPFCHNRDLVIPAKNLDYFSEKALLNDLKKRKKWIDGLVITGGEPTLQPDLIEFCKKVKKLGISVKLDTNGSNPEVVKKLIKEKLMDFFAVDVKTDPKSYSDLVGSAGDIKKIEESLLTILRSDLDFELRTTVVPLVHKRKNLLDVSNWLKELFDEAKLKIDKRSWVWQNFVGRNCLDEKFNGKIGYPKRMITDWKKEIEKTGIKIILRGW